MHEAVVMEAARLLQPPAPSLDAQATNSRSWETTPLANIIHHVVQPQSESGFGLFPYLSLVAVIDESNTMEAGKLLCTE